MAAVMGMLSSMPPEQRAEIAAQMGIPAAALDALSHAAAHAGAGRPAGVPPGATVVSLTAEEMAAVDRLSSMGFPKERVVEAYLACDKNEELAANYLMDNI
jgi:UV excision repair protein RAD23